MIGYWPTSEAPVHEINKMMSWGMRMTFDNFLIGLWHFGELLLVHCECSLPLLVNQFRGSWIHFQVGLWRGNSDLLLNINE